MFGTKGLGLHLEHNCPIYLIIGFFNCMTKHVQYSRGKLIFKKSRET